LSRLLERVLAIKHYSFGIDALSHCHMLRSSVLFKDSPFGELITHQLEEELKIQNFKINS
jgi:hypothetical protein